VNRGPMNKYRAQSKVAQLARRRYKTCERKRAFPDRESASNSTVSTFIIAGSAANGIGPVHSPNWQAG
jgi:hypothetical protein